MSAVVLLSRGLLGSFVAAVTLWYFLSPYGVRPHPTFQADIENMITAKQTEANYEGRWVENWTKWRLQLGGEEGVTVYSQQRVNIENMSLPLSAVLEWRSDYKAQVEETATGSLGVTTNHPWGTRLGLYHHYDVKVESGRRVLFLPTFLFGAPQEVLDSLYGSADEIPTIGMMAGSTGGDRIIVQCFMNLVILTVILLLWANNPPSKSKEE